MSPDLQNKLIKRFPMIFADVYSDMSRTCMVWGMECGDGWYDAIYLACLGIEEEYKKTYPWYTRLYYRISFEFIHRWNKLINKQPDWMYRKVVVKYNLGGQEREVTHRYKRFFLHLPTWARAMQVKEKFGTLRFYLTSGTEKMLRYAEMAEALTVNICETCGEHGKLRGRRWLYTACEEHTKEEDKTANEY